MNSGNSSIQWYFDGMPLPDDTLDVCVPAVDGNYTVTLIDEFGCESESDPTAVFLSLEQLSNMNWSIFPNPAGDVLNIRVDGFDNIEHVEIVDMLGRSVLRSDEFAGEEQFDLSGLNNGSYIVRLLVNEQIFTKSLIIHKK
jgi:hypothetical protein